MKKPCGPFFEMVHPGMGSFQAAVTLAHYKESLVSGRKLIFYLILTHTRTNNAAGELAGHIGHLVLRQMLCKGIGIGVILQKSGR